MAEYKLIQDLDVEDKLIGPFTFKQFIFLIIASICGAGAIFGFNISPIISVIFAPPTLAFFVLAVYRRPDQQVETYLAALFGFWFKPRTRIWSRDGIAEHVLITAPKKIEPHYDDGRSKEQVKGQLKELAKIVDTRGWSTRQRSAGDDRLVGFDEVRYSTAPANFGIEDSSVSEDIMDDSDPVSQAFGTASQQATSQARQHAVQVMQQAQQDNNQANNSQG